MRFTGEYIINAAPEVVWKALNDPDVLRQAIPGCQSLEKISDTELKATVGTRIGPMQTNFSGNVTLSDFDPPHGYTISGTGNGGVAGNAKGEAKVRLEPDPAGTKLTYEAEAVVTGKLAALGSRLIDATSKMMAGQFFGKFQEIVGQQAQAGETAAPAPAPQGGSGLNLPVAAIVALAAVAALVLYYVFAR